jgi:hypothetical protein
MCEHLPDAGCGLLLYLHVCSISCSHGPVSVFMPFVSQDEIWSCIRFRGKNTSCWSSVLLAFLFRSLVKRIRCNLLEEACETFPLHSNVLRT